jgi:hypothetical protein
MRIDPEFYKGKNLTRLFMNAINKNDVSAIKLLFELEVEDKKGKLEQNNRFSYSIYTQRDDVVYALLDLFKPYATKGDVKRLCGEASQYARIDYFSAILLTYSNLITSEEAAYSAYKLIYEISGDEDNLLSPEKHTAFLRYILSIPTQHTL